MAPLGVLHFEETAAKAASAILRWRVSEGGTAEPFHSQGSVMPAWKYHLSEMERWQVISFARTLSVSTFGE